MEEKKEAGRGKTASGGMHGIGHYRAALRDSYGVFDEF